MARFDDNWEKEFKPSWETTISTNAKKGNPNESRTVSDGFKFSKSSAAVSSLRGG